MTISIEKPAAVKLISAIMASEERLLPEAISSLKASYGPSDVQSQVFPFEYSDYYSDEMGTELVKVFVAFGTLIQPEEIVARKLEAIECEKRFLRAGTSSRTVNIDPGYLDRMKVVLATTKNASHRVCIGSGIYGDVELVYRSGAFSPLDWTYPDYRTALALEFFGKVRREYLGTLKTRQTEDLAC